MNNYLIQAINEYEVDGEMITDGHDIEIEAICSSQAVEEFRNRFPKMEIIAMFEEIEIPSSSSEGEEPV